ncbi:hypothetical protein UF75_3796 [Desulfosporosinus sp. I2]|uniref:AAA family ATPase n=1 Tax=Desulfosporosinus sp. I2 TaxID=1617025 RepID=UPI0005F02C45|nr:cellulose synthase operon protein YhjQ/BcsQ [Desulfosporosinus sp. I2]KJR45811.1 hypothetical protein UF75_3796 [Desulfosporosinus sp. I2]
MEYSDTITNKRGLFERLMRRSGVSSVVAANQMIAVWGTQGGVGASSLTAILAKLLHQWGFTVLVIEATPTGGSFLRLFAKKPVSEGLDTISRSHERLNTELASIRVNIIKGLSVLPKSGAPHNSQWIWQEKEVHELLRIAKKMAGFVLVDVGHLSNDALARETLAEADHIVSVFRSTTVGLDSATRFYEHCKYANLNDKVVWVTNQVHHTKDASLLGAIIGQKVEYSIPWNKGMENIDQGCAVPRNILIVAEELLHNLISAPSSRIF